MTRSTTQTPPTEPKRREKTPSRHAADAHDKIVELKAECEAELATTPDAIRKKYAEKIAKVSAGLDAEAKALLGKMLSE